MARGNQINAICAVNLSKRWALWLKSVWPYAALYASPDCDRKYAIRALKSAIHRCHQSNNKLSETRAGADNIGPRNGQYVVGVPTGTNWRECLEVSRLTVLCHQPITLFRATRKQALSSLESNTTVHRVFKTNNVVISRVNLGRMRHAQRQSKTDRI